MTIDEAKGFLDSALKAWQSAVQAEQISEGDRSISRNAEQALKAVQYWQRQVKHLEDAASNGSGIEYRIATWNTVR